MVDTEDLKSSGGDSVTVRARSPVPNNKRKAFAFLLLFYRDKGSNPSKCGADERRRRGLDRAAP